MDVEEKAMMMRPAAERAEAELFLKWGSRKRLRCVRIRSNNNGGSTTTSNTTSPPSSSLLSDPAVDPVHQSNSSTRIRHRRIAANSTRFLSPNDEKSRLTRNSEVTTAVGRRVSPEKEERTYTTRGSVVAHHHLQEENGGGGGGNGNVVWPKLYIALSSKEKEEDFLAMKGCKPPQRPKKRAKLIQRTILLVSPGAWLTDMSMERYEVREKKTSKKRPRGLKAMGDMESSNNTGVAGFPRDRALAVKVGADFCKLYSPLPS
ncbi:OLC1v1038266C1 [Oldenlandia corymbosa var. corymbosa]|uniref:OLC1v1038266C1 n=1 Tax=Oldenlandia corymbosa var. corymbosa TaxID=529605 RepID=A0AAV1D1Q0_OLDCO|nr:OLC1v1038266C1 [Oldenlandia corymbosa var. corymbosa]